MRRNSFLKVLLSLTLVMSSVPLPVTAFAESIDETPSEEVQVAEEEPAEATSFASESAEEVTIPAEDDGTQSQEEEHAVSAEQEIPADSGSATEAPEVIDADSENTDDEADGETEGENEAESESEAALEESKPEEVKLEASAEKQEAPSVSVQAHVQNIGWQKAVGSGEVAGTSGKSLRVEAFRISLVGAKDKIPAGSIETQAHVQNIGWQNWIKDGAVAGTTGKSLRVEALRIRLTGDVSKTYDVYYQAHVQNLGWMALAKNGEASGSAGHSYRVEAVRVWLVPKGGKAPSASSDRSVAYVGNAGLSVQAHVQNVGWQAAVGSGATAGTTGRSLRVEALRMSVGGVDASGSVEYRAHVQNVGWQDWVRDGSTAGTTGRGLRVEALQVRLTGGLAEAYDIYYRAHVSNVGWLGWAKNGEKAGSEGMSQRVEAVQVRLVAKGSAAPSASDAAFTGAFMSKVAVSYAGYVKGSGWGSWTSDGKTAGTTGKSLMLEATRLKVSTAEGSSSVGITYRNHVQNKGWISWASNGAGCGSGGSGLRVEAIQIKLTGDAAKMYDVYYRAHVSGRGWLGWAKNGASAGSIGMSKAVEAYQVTLVPKGGAAPGSTANACLDKTSVGNAVVAAAYSQIGAAYTEANDYYEANVAFNCSGFSYYCYMKAGYIIPRKQGYYSYYWNEENKEYSQMWWVEKRGNWTTDVARLSPGDLVFFSPINDKYHTGHVGVYVGNSMMIDAFPGYGVSRRSVYQSGFVGGGNPLF